MGNQTFQKLITFITSTIFVPISLANPVGGNVISGGITINQMNPNHTIVNQSTPNGIINWQSFNIGAGETTSFLNGSGITLNRVNPASGMSSIYGRLTATGKIIIVNQSGIFFGPGSVVDVGGIIASTSDISNENFNAGRYIFDRPSPTSAAVVNEGTIRAAQYGLVALVGTGVQNDGTIQANLGSVVLASGNKFTFDLAGDRLINFAVTEPATTRGIGPHGPLRNGVSNRGTILADGGRIIMTARAAQGVLDNSINMEGVAQARSVYQRNGEIILSGEGGPINVAGRLDVRGTQGHSGGTVKVLAKKVRVIKPAVIDASGDAGGGLVLLGGNFYGKGPEPNSVSTFIDSGAVIMADATRKGKGGGIAIWSDGDTRVYGNISAKGGPTGGEGGFVETSGHYLDVNGATVNTSAPLGKTGTWLLDPTNIDICTGGGCAPTFNASVLYNGTTNFSPNGAASGGQINADFLLTQLNTNNITVSTAGPGPEAGDITVSAPLVGNGVTKWNSPNTLALLAAGSVFINNVVSGPGAFTASAGTGNVLVNANISTASFGASGNTIVFNNSPVITTTGGSPFSQVYSNPVVLTAGTNTTFSETGGQTIFFGSTINGAGSLAVNNTGTVQFNDSLGNTTPLTSLIISGAGFIQPPGNPAIVRTTGNQIWNGPLSSSFTPTFETVSPGAVIQINSPSFSGLVNLNLMPSGGNSTVQITTPVANYGGTSVFVTGTGVNNTLSVQTVDPSQFWIVTGPSSGDFASTDGLTFNGSFSGIQNLVGGLNADTFMIAGDYAGLINGGASGIKTLDFRFIFPSVHTLSLTGVSSNGFSGVSNVGPVGGFTNINAVIAPNTSVNTIVGPNLDNSWTLGSLPPSTLSSAGKTLNFTDYRILTGGSGSDNFVFTTPGFNGLIDGGGGLINRIDLSALNFADQTQLNGLGSQVGYSGLSSLGFQFTNINQLLGPTATATTNRLTGPNLPSFWALAGIGTGNLSSQGQGFLLFQNYPNLIGQGFSNVVSLPKPGVLTLSSTMDTFYEDPIHFNSNFTTYIGNGSFVDLNGLTPTFDPITRGFVINVNGIRYTLFGFRNLQPPVTTEETDAVTKNEIIQATTTNQDKRNKLEEPKQTYRTDEITDFLEKVADNPAFNTPDVKVSLQCMVKSG